MIDYLKKHRGIWTVCFLYGIVLSFITISRFNNFRAEACDMALFDQLIWNSAHGDFGWITFLHKSYFTEHFSPILVLISPIYWIFDNPRLLLVIQSFCLGFAALPLYLIGLEVFKDKKTALLIAVSYLITPKLWSANFFDFHQEAFLPLFLLALFYNLIKKNYKLFSIFLFLAFLVREDVAIYSAAISLYAIFVKKFKLFGTIVFILSICWAIATIKFIIPSFSGGSYAIFGSRYTYLGNNFFSIIITIISKPLVLLKHLSNREIIATLSLLFQRALFLPFLSLSALFLVVIPLFVNVASDYVHQYVLSGEYVLPVLPFIFIAIVYGYHGLMNSNIKFKKSKTTIILLASLLVAFVYYPKVQDLKINHTFMVVFVVMLFVSIFRVFKGKFHSVKNQILYLILLVNIAAWFNDIPQEIKCLKMLRHDSHVKIGQEMLKLIPKNASISAQARYLPHLSHRKHSYLFPDVPDCVEYIVLDKKGYRWPLLDKVEYERYVDNVVRDSKIIFNRDGVLLINVKQDKNNEK